MKKHLLFTVITLFSIVLMAQENSNTPKDIFSRKHEVRVGAVKLLAGPIFEASYEYIKDSNQGFGAHLLVNFDKSNDWFENFSITPYYRMYFTSYEDFGAKGFFVEGFSSFFTGNFNLVNSVNGVESNKDVFDISLGLALGKKWINTSGFVFETKFGVGRNLLGNADSDVIIKADLYIGYRF